MNLPTIRPLIENPPRWTDGTETECGCNWCQHWYPIIKHIEAQLDEEGKKLFNELGEHYDHVEMDGDVAQAKLDGGWPGWEKMKDFKPDYGTDS